MNKYRIVQYGIGMFLAIFGMVFPAAAETTPTATALQVNDGAVTYFDIRRLVPAESESNLARWAGEMDAGQFALQVQTLLTRVTMDAVRNTLLYQFARRDLEKNDSFTDALAKVRAEQKQHLLLRYDGNEARAREDYARQGFSLDDVLDEMERSFIVSSYWEMRFPRDVRITRADMLQYYREHLASDYTRREKLRFQLIDIHADRFAMPDEAAQAARDAWEKLRAGADFSAIVQEYSHGFLKSKDGVWPEVNPASLQEQYLPVTESLAGVEVGDFTAVTPGQGRFFIAKLLDRQTAGVTPFSDVQFEIRDILYRRLQQKHNIVITSQLLEDAAIGDLERFVQEAAFVLYYQVRQFPAANDLAADK